MATPFKDLVAHKAKAADDDTELEIIGAGLCRTGTSSLHSALTILGFDPCHHMASLFEEPKRSIAFIDALENRQADRLPAAYDRFPCNGRRPRMRFRTRTFCGVPKSESCSRVTGFTGDQIPVFPITFLRLQSQVVNAILKYKWKARYGVNSGPEVYVRHVEFIRKLVPKEQLLEFNVKEGWEPLCKFLGVSVPNVPFPRTNDTAMINKAILMAQLMGFAAWTGIAAVLGGSYYWGVRMEGWKTVAGFLGKFSIV